MSRNKIMIEMTFDEVHLTYKCSAIYPTEGEEYPVYTAFSSEPLTALWICVDWLASQADSGKLNFKLLDR